MSKVKVKPQIYASEEIIQDAVNAANSQRPAGKEPASATVVRDAAGKVVEVNVNLPDWGGSGIENAKNKINENNGVAKASAFPKNYTEDFESIVGGQYSVFDGLGTFIFADYDMEEVSPIEGLKSISYQDNYGMYDDLICLINASTLGLSNILAYSFQFKAKAGAGSGISKAIEGLNNYLNATVGSNFKFGSTDLGVPCVADQVYTIKYTYTPNLVIIEIDGVVVKMSVGSYPALTQARLGVGNNYSGLPVISDSWIFSVLDGN